MGQNVPWRILTESVDEQGFRPALDYGLFDMVDMEEVYRETFPDLEIRICQIGETACNTQWKTG